MKMAVGMIGQAVGMEVGRDVGYIVLVSEVGVSERAWNFGALGPAGCVQLPCSLDLKHRS